MTIEINLVDEVLDILRLTETKTEGADTDGVLNWLYEHTNHIARFLLGKYQTHNLSTGGQSYEELAELIVERLQGE